MRLASISLSLLEHLSPRRYRNRMRRELLKGLPEKLRTAPSEMYPLRLSARFLNWCDAAVALKFISAAERSRRVPNATINRGIRAGPAPGNELKVSTSACDETSSAT